MAISDRTVEKQFMGKSPVQRLGGEIFREREQKGQYSANQIFFKVPKLLRIPRVPKLGEEGEIIVWGIKSTYGRFKLSASEKFSLRSKLRHVSVKDPGMPARPMCSNIATIHRPKQ